LLVLATVAKGSSVHVVPFLLLCTPQEDEHGVSKQVNNGSYKENKSPVVQILVLVDDEAGEGGCEEAHNVCEPIGDSQQSPGVVGRHVDVSAHKT